MIANRLPAVLVPNLATRPVVALCFNQGGSVINLKLSGYEDFHTISFKKLLLLLDIGTSDEPYKSISHKLKKVSSIAEAFNLFSEDNSFGC